MGNLTVSSDVDTLLQSNSMAAFRSALGIYDGVYLATDPSVGMVNDGVTDNTAALQAWLDDAASAKEDRTLIVPDGVYVFSGALQDTSRCNAQIILPSLAISGRQYSVTIKGEHPLACSPSGPTSIVAPQGPIFKSTLATGGGTRPCFIGGRGPSGGVYNETSFVHIVLEEMIFQTVQDPAISCVNLNSFTSVELRGNVLIMAGNTMATTDMVQPTTSTSYGLLLPRDSSGIMQRGDHINIFNFYTGAWIGELSHIHNLGCWSCYYTIEFGFAYHLSLIERFLDFWSPYGVHVTDVHPFQIQQMAVERSATGQWYSRVSDVVDSGNKAIGDITWWTVTANVGAQDVFDVDGGSSLKIRRLGGAYDSGGGGGIPPGAVVYDSFTDTDGTGLPSHTMDLGAGWTRYEGSSTNQITVQSNKATSYLDAGNAYAYSVDSGVSDGTVTANAIFGATDTSHYCQIVFRLTDASNFWTLRVNGSGSSNVELVKTVSGSETVVSTGSLTISGTIALQAVISGTSISVTAGSVNLTTTDSFNQTATKVGLRMYHAAGIANTMDAFTVSP